MHGSGGGSDQPLKNSGDMICYPETGPKSQSSCLVHSTFHINISSRKPCGNRKNTLLWGSWNVGYELMVVALGVVIYTSS